MVTYTVAGGHIVHSLGKKELSKEQIDSISELMSRVWDSLSPEKRKELTKDKKA